jgi:hypothetical protein
MSDMHIRRVVILKDLLSLICPLEYHYQRLKFSPESPASLIHQFVTVNFPVC